MHLQFFQAFLTRIVLFSLTAISILPQVSTPPRDQRLEQVETQLRELTKVIEELRNPAAANNTPASTSSRGTNDPTSRIRDEGLNRSQLAATLIYLTDVIGPRLTSSPNLKRANEWTRDKMAGWGLANSHLEAWGPFGTGWSLKRFSMQVIEPQTIIPIGHPKAWSPGLRGPITGELVAFNPKNQADLDKLKGTLKGAVILWGEMRETKARFEPPATRLNESNLLRLANAAQSGGTPGRFSRNANSRNSGTNAVGRGGSTNRSSTLSAANSLKFLVDEGAAVVLTPSTQGDGGTFFVSSASSPVSATGRAAADAPRVWSTNAPANVPQITVATEDFNRMLRMIQAGEKLKMTVDLQVEFHDADTMSYNTIAEIPGTDLKDEIVMLGAHLDSWHSGTGATDNGAGCSVVMEAMRILRALDLKPKRTIRVALWTGEEQGLLGSKAYVSSHFGYYTNITNSVSQKSGEDKESSAETRTERKLVKLSNYEKFSTYFNLDNGSGKIRGVFMQGNDKTRSIFRGWLQPFEDLGAETVTISNTGGTDHLSFDAIGLPGFQFIQDSIEYSSRTHHSNQDVFDRIQVDDLKQAAVIMASFAYKAATMEERMPRKKVDESPTGQTGGR